MLLACCYARSPLPAVDIARQQASCFGQVQSNSGGRIVLIAHLSDPHLRQRGHLYQGLIDSNAMFDLALDTLAALRPEPDIVIIGGDLVDEGTEAEYETVRDALQRLHQPVYAIPGNHDERKTSGGAFRAQTISLPLVRCISTPGIGGLSG